MNLKITLLLLLALSGNVLFGQPGQKIKIPKGIVYNYCDTAVYENAKNEILKELSEKENYALVGKMMFIGPMLWKRFSKNKELKNMEGGNTTLLVDNQKLSAKLTQTLADSKKVWDELRKEMEGKTFTLRKANPDELQYYWSVINFDIEEPLVVVETDDRRYILNIDPSTMQLLWVDEAP
jgi:hypothetical protein